MIEKRIFICGCGHSGTSLLLAILSAHPMCYGINIETAMFNRKKFHLTRLMRLKKYERLALAQNRQILVEKTPKHVYRIEYILNRIPDSEVIVCVRNPFDVVASLKKRHGDLNSGIERYVVDNQAWLEIRDKQRFQIVRYEDLVSRPETVLREVCSAVGIPYAENMLEYHQSDRLYFGGETAEKTDGREGANHIALRNWQLKQPISNSMIGEWRTRINRVEYDAIKQALGGMIGLMGYDFSDDWMRAEG